MSDTALKRVNTAGRNRIILICMFAVYAVLTFIGALNHEVWFDEAQAWDIARDNDIPGIYTELQAEGHPMLWYLILHIFTSAGFTVDVIPFISWFITCVSAALVLFKAPFELPLKLMILFSSGFTFYFSVQSRVYCLVILFMTFIAMMYKRRNENPVIFGVLVGLLSNTHIMMCGLVGMLGIYMIIDLFRLWKTSPKKLNILRLVGLAVAGIGVIASVIPLLGSLQRNNETADTLGSINIAEILQSLVASFYNITCNACFDGNVVFCSNTFIRLICWLHSVCFILLFIYLRHYKRAFIIQLVYTLFFIAITEVLWFTIPSRACIYLYSFAFSYWLVKDEGAADHREYILKNFDCSGILNSLFNWLRRTDCYFRRTFLCILCAAMASTIPMGMYILFSDYVKSYSQSERAADFIRANIPADSVLVVGRRADVVSQYYAYLPEYKFYSIEKNQYMTYDKHDDFFQGISLNEEVELDYQKIYDDLKDYENLYLISFDRYPLYDSEPIYSAYGALSSLQMRSDINFALYEFDLDVVPCF